MAQIVADNFNGTAGQTLQAYNPAWVKTANAPGDMLITAAGAVMNGGGATGGYYRSDAAPPSADYSVSADITTGSSILGLTARTQTNAATFYQARFSGTNVELYRFTNGSGALLGQASTGGANGQTFNLRLEVEGTAIRAYLDRSTTPILTRTDSGITTAGFAGIRSGTGTGSIDNFSADTTEAANAVQATINWTEASETTAATASVAVRAAISHAEAGEAHAVSGRVDVLAVASWIEAGETTAVQIQVGGGVLIAINHAEASETHVIGVRVAVTAAASWTEGRETSTITAQVQVDQAGDIDALLVPPRQTVVFEGSRRVVAFEGSKHVVTFEGSKRLVEFP